MIWIEGERKWSWLKQLHKAESFLRNPKFLKQSEKFLKFFDAQWFIDLLERARHWFQSWGLIFFNSPHIYLQVFEADSFHQVFPTKFFMDFFPYACHMSKQFHPWYLSSPHFIVKQADKMELSWHKFDSFSVVSDYFDTVLVWLIQNGQDHLRWYDVDSNSNKLLCQSTE